MSLSGLTTPAGVCCLTFCRHLIVFCLPPLRAAVKFKDNTYHNCPHWRNGRRCTNLPRTLSMHLLSVALSNLVPGSFALYCFPLLLTVSCCIECLINTSHANVCAACVLKDLINTTSCSDFLLLKFCQYHYILLESLNFKKQKLTIDE